MRGRSSTSQTSNVSAQTEVMGPLSKATEAPDPAAVVAVAGCTTVQVSGGGGPRLAGGGDGGGLRSGLWILGIRNLGEASMLSLVWRPVVPAAGSETVNDTFSKCYVVNNNVHGWPMAKLSLPGNQWNNLSNNLLFVKM